MDTPDPWRALGIPGDGCDYFSNARAHSGIAYADA
jgi:hypothetical protein